MRLAILVAALMLLPAAANAATTCTFETVGTTLRLTADCTTDATISIPDGFTLDGANFTITATDPAGGHFQGAVVMNAGASASIVNTGITAQSLADVCDGGPGRLRGIFLDGAAGSIRRNRITGINQGASRCQEGNGIEIRSLAQDGPPVSVEIADNVVEQYQKSGIVITGSVDAWVHDNRVGASVNQERLAANAIQVGYDAWALVTANRIAANSWLGYPGTLDVATGVLLFRAAPGTTVSGNAIGGAGDIGIYIAADAVVVEANELVDEGDDLGGYDIGIADYGSGNRVSGNTVRGYQVPYDSLGGSAKSKVASAR